MLLTVGSLSRVVTGCEDCLVVVSLVSLFVCMFFLYCVLNLHVFFFFFL